MSHRYTFAYLVLESETLSLELLTEHFGSVKKTYQSGERRHELPNAGIDESNGFRVASIIDSQAPLEDHIEHLLERFEKSNIGSLAVKARLLFFIQTDGPHAVQLNRTVMKKVSEADVDLTISFD